MRFDIISDIGAVETIAVNTGIREVERLRKVYGKARWRKKKGLPPSFLPMAPSMHDQRMGAIISPYRASLWM